MNLKPGGTKEIVLEVTGSGLNGKLDMLSEMIDQKVEVSLDSLIVSYNIILNARDNKPLITYQVDENGIVSEAKPDLEQQQLTLGLPPEKVETKEETDEVDRDIVDEFIRSGLAPTYDDLKYDFENIMKRRFDGESYLKMARELEISSGKLAEVIDEYRKRVAPLAKKWNDWREEKGIDTTATEQEQKDVDKETTDDDQDSKDEGKQGAA